MQQMIYDNWVYTQLVERAVHRRAHDGSGTASDPHLNAYSKMYWTAAAQGRIGAKRSGRGRMRGSTTSSSACSSRSLTVFVAITLNFVLFRTLSGDAVSALRCRQCSAEFKEYQREELGLDKSKWEQYQLYLRTSPTGTSASRCARSSRSAMSSGRRSRTRCRWSRSGRSSRSSSASLVGRGLRVAARHLGRQGRPLERRSRSTRCRPSGSAC